MVKHLCKKTNKTKVARLPNKCKKTNNEDYLTSP